MKKLKKYRISISFLLSHSCYLVKISWVSQSSRAVPVKTLRGALLGKQSARIMACLLSQLPHSAPSHPVPSKPKSLPCPPQPAKSPITLVASFLPQGYRSRLVRGGCHSVADSSNLGKSTSLIWGEALKTTYKSAQWFPLVVVQFMLINCITTSDLKWSKIYLLVLCKVHWW